MNIYITGHGTMIHGKENRIAEMAAEFYVNKDESLNMDLIPAILAGTKGHVTGKTKYEHYLLGTMTDSQIDDYHIESFDTAMETISFGERQTLRQYQNKEGDINVFPYTMDEGENTIVNVPLIVRRGNRLSDIVKYYNELYPEKKLTFHWCSCRTIIYPDLV